MQTYEYNGVRFRVKSKLDRNGNTVDTVKVVFTQADVSLSDFLSAVQQLQTELGGNQ